MQKRVAVSTFFRKYKVTLIYGCSLAILMFILKWMHLRLMLISNATEIYIGFIALLFTCLGVWIAVNIMRPRAEALQTAREQQTGNAPVNAHKAHELGLTKRELEVLTYMSHGLSNQEIASTMFLSVSTIKTHSSNLFMKMDVQRRTQAIDKGKKLGLIP